jgi:hypothetical protein
MGFARCIGCACHDQRACVDEATGQACSWLVVDYAAHQGVWSTCPEALPRWRAGDRTETRSAPGQAATAAQRRVDVDMMLAKSRAQRRTLDARYLADLDRYIAGEIILREVGLRLRLPSSRRA